MSKKQKRESLMTIAVQRVGPVQAYKALVFATCWGHCTKKLGRPPVTVDEYADWWNKSRAMGFREQRVFRDAFPEHETPTALCAWIEEQDVHVFEGNPAVAAFRFGALL